MKVIRRFRIVVALDDSEYSSIVLEHALDHAVRHDTVDVHCLTIVGDEREIEAAGQGLSLTALEGFETVSDVPGDRRARLHVRIGNTVEEIARFAGEIQADLLVVGRFGTHSRRHRSLAGAIVDAAPCPTLVVGLTEHEAETTRQCEACVAIREATDAETWFCPEHQDDGRLHSSALMPWSSTMTHSRVW